MPPVIHADRTLFCQLSDPVDSIRHTVTEIFILRHLSGMTEEVVASQLRIILPHFKSHTDTGCNMGARILDLHHDLGAEIHPRPVRASVFLSSAQIAEHTSFVFRVICRLVQKIRRYTSIENDLNRIHHRRFSRAALSAEEVYILVQLKYLMADAAPVIDQNPGK